MRTLLFPSGSSANPPPARAPARVKEGIFLLQLCAKKQHVTFFCGLTYILSRVKFGEIVTAIVTGYFGPKNCHGLLGASRVSFSKIVTGYSKKCHGEKTLGLGRV